MNKIIIDTANTGEGKTTLISKEKRIYSPEKKMKQTKTRAWNES